MEKARLVAGTKRREVARGGSGPLPASADRDLQMN